MPLNYKYITNDSGQWWCWITRSWQAQKKPVVCAVLEIQMASRSDQSARIVVEKLSSEG